MDPCSLPTKSCHGASNRAVILGFLQIQFEANLQQSWSKSLSWTALGYA